MATDIEKFVNAMTEKKEVERVVAARSLHLLIYGCHALLAKGIDPGTIADAFAPLAEKDERFFYVFQEWSPLMVALQRKAGREVRCPVEVSEVANDVAAALDSGVVPDLARKEEPR